MRVWSTLSRTVRFHDALPERTVALRRAVVASLSEALVEATDIRTHARLAAEVQHARALCAGGLLDADSASLGFWVARHDFERGLYAAARDLQERVLGVARSLFGECHPNTLTSVSNLAETLRAQGDLAGARHLHEQVLAVRRRLLGEEHPDTLTSMNNLAETLRAHGDLAGACHLHEQALAVRRRLLGETHPDTLTSMSNVALTLYALGDLGGAHHLLTKVFAARRHLLGEEHPHTLTSMTNLAEVLFSQGDLAGARELHEQVLAACHRLLGKEHPDTTVSAWNLMLTLRDAKEGEAAIFVVREYLAWLLTADDQALSADQRTVRGYLEELIGQTRSE